MPVNASIWQISALVKTTCYKSANLHQVARSLVSSYLILASQISGGLMWGRLRGHVPLGVFLIKFKVDFSIGKSKSVKLLLKSFDDKYSFFYWVSWFILFHFLLCYVIFKILASLVCHRLTVRRAPTNNPLVKKTLKNNEI